MKFNKKIYTPRNARSIDQILILIRKYKPLNAEQEYELCEKMKLGDENARDLLIMSNLRFVLSAAKQYIWKGVPFEDLFQAGATGLTLAVDQFDATKGYKLITYAVWYIKRELLRAVNMHKNKGVTIGLEDPIPFDHGEEATLLDKLCLDYKYNADWDARYYSAYHAVLEKVKEKMFDGAADFLNNYCTMTAKGYQLNDVAKKHNLKLWRAKELLKEIESII